MFEIWQLILIGLIFSTAAMVHGLCGFGFGMIAVGIMSMFIDPKIAIPLDLVVASSNCFYLMWRLRKSIMLRETLVLLILSTIAIPFGALYLRNINPGIVIRSLGAVIIIISAITVLKKSKLKIFSSGIF